MKKKRKTIEQNIINGSTAENQIKKKIFSKNRHTHTSVFIMHVCCHGVMLQLVTHYVLLENNITPFTQLLPMRICFTNAGIDNNNI